MPGCSVTPDPNVGETVVLNWVGGGAAAFGAAAILAAISLGGAGGTSIFVFAIVLGAAAGAVLGFFVGYAVNNFNRLHVQDPSTITLSGCVLCAGKNDGIPPFNDGDWTFNLGGSSLTLCGPTIAGLDVTAILTRSAPGNGQVITVQDEATQQVALHCEISSNIGNYAAVGAAIGSVAGAAAGGAAGAAVCAGLSLLTFGIGGALCLLLLAAAVFLGAAVGGVVGDLLGAAVGWIADQLSDFNEKGEAITQGCVMSFTGRWVTNSGHEHNEIHDIASAQLIECLACQTDATGVTSLCLTAAVGIGRHPTGRDP